MVATRHRWGTRPKYFGGAGLIATGLLLMMISPAHGQNQSPAPVRAVGTVKAISGNSVTVTTDTGATLNLIVQESTRMVRATPGQKDLQGAAAVHLQELQPGDRVLARGTPLEDSQSILAVSVVVMKGADIAAKQERDREDWRKRGVGGLVKAVDVSQGNLTISVSGFSGNKAVQVKVSKETIVRRYAPDSVKFDDAKPGTLDQIKPGDQLRARGTRSADGGELNAEEIVSGSFRNIAGTVISIDAAGRTITVSDLESKHPVTLKVNDDSQLRTLPPMMAERIARRLKGESPADANANGRPDSPAAQPAGTHLEGMGGGRPGGSPDFQQMLARMPAVSIADLQKGTAVMLVATEGNASNPPTAITLLSGVEAILTASPNSSRAAMLLSPWNLGGTGGDAALGANP